MSQFTLLKNPRFVPFDTVWINSAHGPRKAKIQAVCINQDERRIQIEYRVFGEVQPIAEEHIFESREALAEYYLSC